MSRDEILADLALETVVWFDVVDDETLDQDLAVKQLEEAGYAFHQLERTDREWLAARARAKAGAEPLARRRQVFEAIAEDLEFVDE